MTTTASPTQMTPDDLLRLPDAGAYELIDGEPVERHMSRESSRVAARILVRLGAECERTGEAEAYPNELGYQCFADQPRLVRRGDASVVRMDRLAGVDLNPGYLPIPADLIVEVISPTDLFWAVSEKIALYLANGFGQVWVVDPAARTVTVHRPGETPLVYLSQDEVTAAPALASFRCRVSEFFDR